ncbi:hypothetical protein HY570_02645, partial [Candidatus Micrarchaeota archaeon]|nr:hypothetical protein [Candidatus Micrarchaeota archaeon]
MSALRVHNPGTTPSTGRVPIHLSSPLVEKRLDEGKTTGLLPSLVVLREIGLLNREPNTNSLGSRFLEICSSHELGEQEAGSFLTAYIQMFAEYGKRAIITSENLEHFLESLDQFLLACSKGGLVKPNSSSDLHRVGTRFAEIYGIMEEKGFIGSDLLLSLIGSVKAGLFKTEEDLLAVQGFIQGLDTDYVLRKFQTGQSPALITQIGFNIYVNDAPNLALVNLPDFRPMIPGLEIAVETMNKFLQPNHDIRFVDFALNSHVWGASNPNQIVVYVPSLT